MAKDKSPRYAQGKAPYRGPWPPPLATTEVKMTAPRMKKLLDLVLDVVARQEGRIEGDGASPYNTTGRDHP